MTKPNEPYKLIRSDDGGAKYFRVIVFSIVLPFILVYMVVSVATYLALTVEGVQDNSQRAISSWYKLDTATRRHFSIHDSEITHDAWVGQVDLFDRVLGDLRSGDLSPPYSWGGLTKGWRDAENAVDSGL